MLACVLRTCKSLTLPPLRLSSDLLLALLITSDTVVQPCRSCLCVELTLLALCPYSVAYRSQKKVASSPLSQTYPCLSLDPVALQGASFLLLTCAAHVASVLASAREAPCVAENRMVNGLAIRLRLSLFSLSSRAIGQAGTGRDRTRHHSSSR